MFEPRPHQAEAIRRVGRHRRHGHDRALLDMATGTGKTVVAAHVARKFLDENPQARVLFLCHQNDILQQAQQTFAEVLGPGRTHGFFHGGAKDLREVTCLYASFQAMATWREAFRRDEFDLVVVDESHHGQAPTYRPTVEHFTPSFLLGMTATPDRADLRDIRRLFGPEVYSLPLERALAEDLLVPVDYRLITDEVVDVGSVLTSRGRLTLRQLNNEFFAPKRNEEILRLLQQRAADVVKPRALGFCQNVGQADWFAGHYPGARAWHSGLSKEVRDQNLAAFRAGIVSALFTVDMANEGIDIPDVNLVFFLRATASRTVFLQQLGRGARPMPGKDQLTVLDLVGNCERLALVQRLWRDVEDRAEVAGRTETRRPPLAVHVGTVRFHEQDRDVFEVLAEIRDGHSRDVLLKKLQDFTEQLGHTPTQREFKAASGMPPLRSYLVMFGRWSNALRAIGREPQKQRIEPSAGAVLAPAGSSLLDQIAQLERGGTLSRNEAHALRRSVNWYLQAHPDSPRSSLTIERLDPAALVRETPMGQFGADAALRYRTGFLTATELFDRLSPGVLGSAGGRSGAPLISAQAMSRGVLQRVPRSGEATVVAPAAADLLSALPGAGRAGAELSDKDRRNNRTMAKAVLGHLTVPASHPLATMRVEDFDLVKVRAFLEGRRNQQMAQPHWAKAFRAAVRAYEAANPGVLGSEATDSVSVPATRPLRNVLLSPAGADLMSAVDDVARRGELQPWRTTWARKAIQQLLASPDPERPTGIAIQDLAVKSVLTSYDWTGMKDATRRFYELGLRISADVYETAHPGVLGARSPDREVLAPAAEPLLRALEVEQGRGALSPLETERLQDAVREALRFPLSDPRAAMRIEDLDVHSVSVAGRRGRPDFLRATDIYEASSPQRLGAALPDPVRLSPAGATLLAVVNREAQVSGISPDQVERLRRGVSAHLRVAGSHPLASVTIEQLDPDLVADATSATSDARASFLRAVALHDAAFPGMLGSAVPGYVENRAVGRGPRLPPNRVLPPAGWELLAAILAERRAGELTEVQAAHLARSVATFLAVAPDDPLVALGIRHLDVEARIRDADVSHLQPVTASTTGSRFRTVARLYEAASPGVLGADVAARAGKVLGPAGELLIAEIESASAVGDVDSVGAAAMAKGVRAYLRVDGASPLAALRLEDLDVDDVIASTELAGRTELTVRGLEFDFTRAARFFEQRRPGLIGAARPQHADRLVLPPAAVELVRCLEARTDLSPRQVEQRIRAVRAFLEVPASSQLATVRLADLDVERTVAAKDLDPLTPAYQIKLRRQFRLAVGETRGERVPRQPAGSSVARRQQRARSGAAATSTTR